MRPTVENIADALEEVNRLILRDGMSKSDLAVLIVESALLKFTCDCTMNECRSTTEAALVTVGCGLTAHAFVREQIRAEMAL